MRFMQGIRLELHWLMRGVLCLGKEIMEKLELKADSL